jgi:hypothetical protein
LYKNKKESACEFIVNLIKEKERKPERDKRGSQPWNSHEVSFFFFLITSGTFRIVLRKCIQLDLLFLKKKHVFIYENIVLNSSYPNAII